MVEWFNNLNVAWQTTIVTLFVVIVIAIIGWIFFSGKDEKISIEDVNGDFVSGDKVSYNTYITNVTKEGQSGDNVSDATLFNFFYQYSSAFNNIINKVPEKPLQDLPGFLKKPYSINVVVSECHGVGFEYTVPSDNPEITMIRTTAPIEKHFFTKYTNITNLPISMKFAKISANG